MTTTDTAENEQASAQAPITVNDTTVPSVAAGGPYSGNENTAIALNNGVTVGLSPPMALPMARKGAPVFTIRWR